MAGAMIVYSLMALVVPMENQAVDQERRYHRAFGGHAVGHREAALEKWRNRHLREADLLALLLMTTRTGELECAKLRQAVSANDQGDGIDSTRSFQRRASPIPMPPRRRALLMPSMMASFAFRQLG
jgi:hypothetical protein